MISKKDIEKVLAGYDLDHVTIASLGGHSGLDVCRGAKKAGFKTLAICQKGRDKTYSHYYKTRNGKGVVDDVIVVDKFSDVTSEAVQKQLREKNCLFVHNRYFWVYCNYKDVENKFLVPIIGTRDMVRLEERDEPKNQYYLLEKAGIRLPKMFSDPKKIDRPVIVKVAEAVRGYERAFFVCNDYDTYVQKSAELIAAGTITEAALKTAVIEEYAVGAQVNLNFYYSPLTDEVELMGTDTRRQTNLDGFLRMTAHDQIEALNFVRPKMIETGHVAVTMKESLVEKAFCLGEQFVKATKKHHDRGIMGAFALQGAVVADEGKEDFVIFDVSMRIPGSPGIMFTPYSGYLYGDSISYGDRIAMDVHKALDDGRLIDIVS